MMTATYKYNRKRKIWVARCGLYRGTGETYVDANDNLLVKMGKMLPVRIPTLEEFREKFIFDIEEETK